MISHNEYDSCLAVLGRDGGLNPGVINPADIEKEVKLYAFLWSWVEKVLDGADQPNYGHQSRSCEVKCSFCGFLKNMM